MLVYIIAEFASTKIIVRAAKQGINCNYLTTHA